MIKKTILFLIVLFISQFFINSTLYSYENLTPGLITALKNNTADSLIEVVVFIDDNSTSENLLHSINQTNPSRSDRIKSVIRKLSSFKSSSKGNIKKYLDNLSVTPLKEHWIVPAFTATLHLEEIEKLSQVKGVKKIVENVRLNYDPPVEVSSAPLLTTSIVPNELTLLKVPQLWERGLKGKGRLICSFDTGVEQGHPALSPKWRGNNAALSECWFSKVKPDSLPFDATGHGTHTMGIMVGSLEADSFGVAPEAEWITAGIIDQGRSLSVTISDILEAFQWVVNPDGDTSTTDDVPDVILNSWGIPKGLFIPCDDTFWGVIDNVEAAGIVTIFAAGNEGPDPQTLRSPADRASTPTSSFSIGAVNNSLVIADFSSRGPSSCDPSQFKPEIVAPGVNIRSSAKGGGFSYMSGTSMAAPYIAAAVALIRQYNPEATVQQIKNAFISAAVDLGETGEDNAYGYGFVDLSEVLNYIPSPVDPEIIITGTTIIDDEIPLPGETINLRITLNNPPGNVEIVTGTLQHTDNDGVVLVNNIAEFYFGYGGTYAVNYSPFEITIDESFYHGQNVGLMLLINTPDNSYADTIAFSLMVGVEPIGFIADHNNNRVSLSVSDFGQYGFASGSIYNLLKSGFTFDGSGNLLYEAGIIIGRNSLLLSSSVRDLNGKFRSTDFAPFEMLSEQQTGVDGSIYRTAAFNDAGSEIPIPVDIYQKSYHYEEYGYESLIFFDYIIRNSSIEMLQGLHFGFLADFDLSENENIYFDESLNLIYQKSSDNLFIGLIGLNNISTFKSRENYQGKIGFSNSELFDLISDTNSSIDSLNSSDMMFIVNSQAFSLSPNEFYELSFAFVGGTDLSDLFGKAMKAKEKFDIVTDIHDDFVNNLIPFNYDLHQNYPNPFNPSTNINFTLMESGKVSLEVFNVLGQNVKTIFSGVLESGFHTFQWDATDSKARKVAGGIYFYRLNANGFSQTRKMLLLK